VRCIRLIVLLIVAITGLRGASASGTEPTGKELQAAISLFNAKRYPEARPLLEKIVGADSKNAAAYHYLGRTIAARGDTAALEESLGWLAKAVELEPKNAIYLGIFGGTSLQVAARTNSLSAAKKGRDAMEKALAIDPDYVEAREGLFQFYERAPWPFGSGAKAKVQLEEIRKRNPDLATILGVGSQTRAKNYAAAFKMCEDVLAKNPDNYTALYHYGRTASVSSQHLEQGLASLQKCLTFEPPTPASPTHSNVWQRIGTILEQLNRPADARVAYETALKLDASNQQASAALANLK